MKSYGVTIQMNPLQQYFCMVRFVFQYFPKRNLGFFLNGFFCSLMEFFGCTAVRVKSYTLGHTQKGCILQISAMQGWALKYNVGICTHVEVQIFPCPVFFLIYFFVLDYNNEFDLKENNHNQKTQQENSTTMDR